VTTLDFRFYIRAAENLAEDIAEDSAAMLTEAGARDVIACVLLASSAVESLVNGMLEDYAAIPGKRFEMHERAFMLEQEVRFSDTGRQAGLFVLTGTRYRSLEHKVLFLLGRIAGCTLDKGSRLWQQFMALKRTRDAVVHPRQSRELSLSRDSALNGIATAKNIIMLLGKHVWKKTLRL
jgi:hypothetical protein